MRSLSSNQVYVLALVAFFAWMCIGFFPLYCYEADGTHISAGCEILYHQGWSLPPLYTYGYRMQPLITNTVVALKYVFPFLTCMQIYCIFSAVSSMLFIVGIIEFAHRILPVNKLLMLLALFLLPEAYMVGMYANSAIPAAALYIWALVCICDKRYALSVALLCVAPLYRCDILPVYPVIFPLFLYLGFSFKKSFIYSALYAIPVVVFVLAACWVMNADMLEQYNELIKWGDINTTQEGVIAILGYYSLVYLMLLPIGLCSIIVKKSYKLLFLVLLPIATMHYVYGWMASACKHFLYITPFVAICGAMGILWLRELSVRRKYIGWTAIVIGGFLMVGSLQVQTPKPWRDVPGAVSQIGPRIPLFKIPVSKFTVSVGIGAGQQIFSKDEIYLTSGNVVYPFHIRQFKKHDMEMRQRIEDWLRTYKTYHMYAFNWGEKMYFSEKLLSEGYWMEVQHHDDLFLEYTLTKDGQLVYFTGDSFSAVDEIQREEALAKRIQTIAREKTMDSFVISYDLVDMYLLDNIVKKGLAEKVMEGLYRII